MQIKRIELTDKERKVLRTLARSRAMGVRGLGQGKYGEKVGKDGRKGVKNEKRGSAEPSGKVL